MPDVEPVIVTNLDIVRLEIGDRDITNPLFADDEIGYYLSKHGGNILLAAADCLDSLANRFASGIDFSTDTLSVKKLERCAMMEKRADAMRARAQGVAQVGQIVVDGYSQSIDNTSTYLIEGAPIDPDVPRYGPSWEADLSRQQPNDYIPGSGG